MLADRQIRWALRRGHVRINPSPTDERIQPASVDLTLMNQLLIPGRVAGRTCSLARPWDGHHIEFDSFVLSPGEFVLGSTIETVTLGRRHAARFEGKSSLGRLGLITHVTAGFIDPGFHGRITVELANVGPAPIELIPGQPIGQICFIRLSRACARPYGTASLGSHYQGQVGPTSAKW